MKIDSRYLYQIIPEDSFDRPTANLQLANLLYQTMKAKNGIGLAANQVGYNRRVFVMEVDKIRFCFNPSIEEFSEEMAHDREGCLSFPKEFIQVARYKWIRVKYYNYRGEVVEEILSGLTARCFQHELDHLNGITMHKRHKEQNHVLSES